MLILGHDNINNMRHRLGHNIHNYIIVFVIYGGFVIQRTLKKIGKFTYLIVF